MTIEGSNSIIGFWQESEGQFEYWGFKSDYLSYFYYTEHSPVAGFSVKNRILNYIKRKLC